MNFIKRIIADHKAYYKDQNELNKSISFKQILYILLASIIFFTFYFIGINLYSKTIVDGWDLIKVSSVLSIVLFIGLTYYFPKFKSNFKIITNLIIYIVHAVLYFCILLLIMNYFTIQGEYVTTKVEVLNWSVHKSKNTSTQAKIFYENEEFSLRFEGDILDEVADVDSLEIEVNSGVAFYYIRSFRIDDKKGIKLK